MDAICKLLVPIVVLPPCMLQVLKCNGRFWLLGDTLLCFEFICLLWYQISYPFWFIRLLLASNPTRLYLLPRMLPCPAPLSTHL
jgi:hypothetical protein